MSVVKGKLMKMEIIQVGEYEFTKQDIIGHGAFAMVYKGRKRKVCINQSCFSKSSRVPS